MGRAIALLPAKKYLDSNHHITKSLKVYRETVIYFFTCRPNRRGQYDARDLPVHSFYVRVPVRVINVWYSAAILF